MNIRARRRTRILNPPRFSGGEVFKETIGDKTFLIHAFKNVGNDNFELIRKGNNFKNVFDVLVVAGGGGGGGGIGGGGGAGGVLFKRHARVYNKNRIYVGEGGTGSTGGDSRRTNNESGENSYFNSLIAIGGGRGAIRTDRDADDGGSGGGGSTGSNPGKAYLYQGHDGGEGGPDTNQYPGGGGGGAGEPGEDAEGDHTPGDGGDGLYFGDKFGTKIGRFGWLGGGGGGTDHNQPQGEKGYGGKGGGGNTNFIPENAKDGFPNTGGGGGAQSYHGSYREAGAGGSGVVILRQRLGAEEGIENKTIFLARGGRGEEGEGVNFKVTNPKGQDISAEEFDFGTYTVNAISINQRTSDVAIGSLGNKIICKSYYYLPGQESIFDRWEAEYDEGDQGLNKIKALMSEEAFLVAGYNGIEKFDNEGELVWKETFGSGDENIFFGLDTDRTNKKIYLGNDEGEIIQIDTDGNIQWREKKHGNIDDIIFENTFFGMIRNLKVDNDGYIITTSWDRFIQKTNPSKEGETEWVYHYPIETYSFEKEDEEVFSNVRKAEVSPNGDYLAIVYNNSPYVIVYDTSDFSVLQEFSEIDEIVDLSFSADNQYLALLKTASEAEYVIYNTSDWSQETEQSFAGFTTLVWGIQFSNDNNFLVIGWEQAQSSNNISVLEQGSWGEISNHPDLSAGSRHFDFSQDDKYFAVALGGDPYVKVFDTENDWQEIEIPFFDSFIDDIKFSSDGEYLFLSRSSSEDDYLTTIRTRDWSRINSFPRITRKINKLSTIENRLCILDDEKFYTIDLNNLNKIEDSWLEIEKEGKFVQISSGEHAAIIIDEDDDLFYYNIEKSMDSSFTINYFAIDDENNIYFKGGDYLTILNSEGKRFFRRDFPEIKDVFAFEDDYLYAVGQNDKVLKIFFDLYNIDLEDLSNNIIWESSEFDGSVFNDGYEPIDLFLNAGRTGYIGNVEI